MNTQTHTNSPAGITGTNGNGNRHINALDLGARANSIISDSETYDKETREAVRRSLQSAISGEGDLEELIDVLQTCEVKDKAAPLSIYQRIETAIGNARGTMAHNAGKTALQDLRQVADQFLTDVTTNLLDVFKAGEVVGAESFKLRAAATVEDVDRIDYKTRMAVAHALKIEDEDLPEIVMAVEAGGRVKDREYGTTLSGAWSAFIGHEELTKEAQVIALTDYLFSGEDMTETHMAALLLWIDMLKNEDHISNVINRLFWHSQVRGEYAEKFIASTRDRVLSQIQTGRKVTKADELQIKRESEVANDN